MLANPTQLGRVILFSLQQPAWIGHRTYPEKVAQLLAGEEPLLMVPDPPYGVGYDPEWRNRVGVSLQSAWARSRTIIGQTGGKLRPG